MTVEAVVKAVKEHLLEGQTAAALDKLIAFLEREEKYEQLLHLAITARSEYSRLEDQQNQGFISREEANTLLNRLNIRLLDITDRLADGRLDVDLPDTPTNKRKRKKMLLLGIPLLLLIGAYLGYQFWPAPPPADQISCPRFAPKADFRVLLLPFKSISGDELKAEYTIKQRLDDLAYQKDLPVDVQIFERFYERSNATFPGFRQAQKIGHHCQADLILWGTAEQTPDNRIVLTSKFKFLGNNEAFQVKKIELEGETDLVAVNSISSILQEGSFTEDVETLILAFYGLMAHQEGRYAEAAEAFEEVAKRGDDMPSEFVHTILADSYLALEKPQKAIEHYQILANIKPRDSIILNNLAWLQIKEGQIDLAIKTAEQLVQIAPDNRNALLTRAYAYLEAKMYERAAQDFALIENKQKTATDEDLSEHTDDQLTPKTPEVITPERVDIKKIKKKPRIRKDKIEVRDKRLRYKE